MDYQTPAFQTTAKPLPRTPSGAYASEFKTEKHTYQICHPDTHGLPLYRYQAYSIMVAEIGFEASLRGIHDKLGAALERMSMAIQDPKNLYRAFAEISTLKDQVQNFATTKERWPQALWLLTVWIVREDENWSDWDEVLAKQKLADWAESGYNALDFFALAAIFAPALLSSLQKSTQNTNPESEATSLQTPKP